jgi:bacillithiol biosynthesis cysteine-adding enzyme BshC
MHVQKLSLAETNSFSSFFLDYIHRKNSLEKFYARYPIIENFSDQIAEREKSFPTLQRETLVSVLTHQYKPIVAKEAAKKNLQQLAHPNTFTITTGHQLNIFTGPLYFIYKIVTVINACRELKNKYPGYHFVPVYWMASEDHDFEEIRYFKLYGKKYVWQTEQKGAVGRFDPRSLESLLNTLPGDVSVFRQAYLNHKTLSDAVRCYVNDLFGDEGLLVLDADNHQLKKFLQPVISDDLFVHSTKKLVEAQSEALTAHGYTAQVSARQINFFYLENNIRNRIEKKGEEYHVVDTGLRFSRKELEKLIEDHPERFSPNVILRPVYQELILPNLAYAGGPAEVVYWLQFKKVFDHFQVPFPILMPRNFAVVIEPPVARKFEKTGLEYVHLFEEKNALFNRWILKNSGRDLSLGKEFALFAEKFNLIRDRAAAIDPTLTKFVEAQSKRTRHSLEKIEEKMLRAEKRIHKEKLGQLEAVKDSLFPNGSPQERVDNFLNFYQADPEFIKKLLACFDPFDFRFHILCYT